MNEQNNIPIEKEKENSTRKGKKGNIIFTLFIGVFSVIILSLTVANFICEDREFSEKENRTLAKAPVFSLYTLKDASFMRDFETYLTDQFVLRDELTSLKTFCNRLLGKRDMGSVYIGEGERLFAKPTPFDEKKATAITDALSAFADKNKQSKLAFALSPNSTLIYSELLPKNLTLPDQNYYIEDIISYTDSDAVTFINPVKSFMRAKSDYELFYKTDHHWTTRAAFIVFEKLMKGWEKPLKKKDYRFMTVTNSFQGTLSSRAGIYSEKDTIEICVPKGSAMTYTVTRDEGDVSASLFDSSFLEGKNKYDVFLGGNRGRLTIDTVCSSKDTLLVIKDSYANCLIPMLTPHFARIVVIDPRYYRESLSALIEEEGFSHIFLLYNLDTLLEDTSLADCLLG